MGLIERPRRSNATGAELYCRSGSHHRSGANIVHNAEHDEQRGGIRCYRQEIGGTFAGAVKEPAYVNGMKEMG
jgi:hypothetical protein